MRRDKEQWNTMRINKAKQKLKTGKPSIGTWLTLGSFHAARVLARMGFDWLTIDAEHAAYDWREISLLAAIIAEADCAPLVRVPEGSHAMIKRALDAGAFGIVVPMVESVEQACSIIAATKYPPLGKRSVGSGMHNLNFDCTAEKYYREADNQLLVVLQIESPLGVRHARAICQLPGCDAIFIGPNDLRFQMRGTDGLFPSEAEFEGAINEVVSIGRQQAMPTGMHVMTLDQAATRIEQGMQFLAVSSDLGLLVEQAFQVTTNLGLAPPADIARY
jgi:4-hydroxy-2-oxoheptanedioate aldolase